MDIKFVFLGECNAFSARTEATLNDERLRAKQKALNNEQERNWRKRQVVPLMRFKSPKDEFYRESDKPIKAH